MSFVVQLSDAALERLRRWSAVLEGAPKFAVAVIAVCVGIVLFAPVLVPRDPIAVKLEVRQTPPSFLAGGRPEYPLGTDRQGRDVLSRVLVGTQVSLSVAASSIGIGGLLGTVLGLLAGYRGGWVDALIMRAVDVFLAFPGILVALALVVTVGPSLWSVILVIALTVWPRYGRLLRGDVLSWKHREFVLAARATGASAGRIIVVHLLPNVRNSVVVLTTLQVGWAILIEASLSFLGAGVPPPTPTLGGMVAEGQSSMETVWWVSVFPGIAILVVVLSFNLFGDWLAATLDPKLRRLP